MFCGHWQSELKICTKMQRSQVVQTAIKKKSTFRKLILPHGKIHKRFIAIKAGWYWQNDKQSIRTKQRIQKQTHTYAIFQFMTNMTDNSMQWRNFCNFFFFLPTTYPKSISDELQICAQKVRTINLLEENRVGAPGWRSH